jgi:hypothetical protein
MSEKKRKRSLGGDLDDSGSSSSSSSSSKEYNMKKKMKKLKKITLDPKTYFKNFAEILINNKNSDLILKFKNSEKYIKAHKFVLVSNSSYFDEIYTKNELKDEFEIDEDYEIFSKMIYFIYSGYINFLDENILEILFLIEKVLSKLTKV